MFQGRISSLECSQGPEVKSGTLLSDHGRLRSGIRVSPRVPEFPNS